MEHTTDYDAGRSQRSAIGPVRLLERHRRSTRNKEPVVERLYTCANGWSLGARRGGPLHIADESTWETFIICPDGYAVGKSVGFVDDPTLDRAVVRLAGWWNGSESR